VDPVDASRSTPRAVLVVPCFNEERRLDASEFLRIARDGAGVGLLFVDDGSTDGTGAALRALSARAPGRIDVLSLDANRGKAEAVRAGLREAVRSGARLVGYADADLSTPVDELLRMVDEMSSGTAKVLLGARVRLLGTDIERRAARHYLGRIFATFASLALELPVYDTQCGAKLFAAGPALAASLERPFTSRWIFDVELLSRLLAPGGGVPGLRREELRELPLRAWRDVRGSKLGSAAMLRAGLELAALFVRRRLARGGARGG
jgi:glycosyltransferase involved in cell wall biosynthesis